MTRGRKKPYSGAERTAHDHANQFHPYSRPAAPETSAPSTVQGQISGLST